MEENNDAIQEQDVSEEAVEEKEVEAPRPEFSTHDSRLEEIAAQRREEIEASNPGPVKPDPEPEYEGPTYTFATDDGKDIVVPATAKYRGKVDGQEFEESIDTVARNFQKNASADKRLEEASRLLREAEQRAQAAAAKQTAPPAQEQRPAFKPPQSLSTDEVDYKAQAKKMLEAFTESDEPEKDLEAILRSISAPRVNEQNLIEAAKKRTLGELQQRRQMAETARIEQARLAANAKFEKEYADVIEDDIAYSAAKQLAGQIWKETPTADPWQVAETVGNKVREWRGAKPTKPAVSKKRKPPVSTPRKMTGRASLGEDIPPVTRKSILEDMKKSRGQAI